MVHVPLRQRGPGFREHPQLGVGFSQFSLGKPWVQFHLVDGGHNAGFFLHFPQLVTVVVRHGNGPHIAQTLKRAQCRKPFHMAASAGAWPVHHVAVQIV